MSEYELYWSDHSQYALFLIFRIQNILFKYGMEWNGIYRSKKKEFINLGVYICRNTG